MAYIYLVLALLLNAAANILLKVGAGRHIVSESSLVTMFFSYWQVGLGIFLFALNVIFYFLTLKMLPISQAYPVMVIGGFLIINSYATVFLKEEITVIQFFGYALMILGVVCVLGFAKS